VRRDLLLQLGGYKGNALTEDIRVTFEIALQKGRIAFARRARAWEDAPDNWEAVRNQRLRWAGGWNIENKRFLEKTPNKRKAIFDMLDFIIVSNGIGFYPILGSIIGLIVFLLGDWLIAMMFLLPALFCILLQAVAAARYAKRPGLVTSFFTLFRLFGMMLRIASKTPEISEWEKTEKPNANSTQADK
jgi:cellulose synthase/poly-beta-1,6-N-acetylglucosamine synthase-like glycosyltransferase